MFNLFKKKKEESTRPEPTVVLSIKGNWLNDFISEEYSDNIKICTSDHWGKEAILAYKDIPFANVSSNYVTDTNFKSFGFSYTIEYMIGFLKFDTHEWVRTAGFFHSVYSQETVEELRERLTEIMETIDEGLRFKEVEKAKYLYIKGMR